MQVHLRERESGCSGGACSCGQTRQPKDHDTPAGDVPPGSSEHALQLNVNIEGTSSDDDEQPEDGRGQLRQDPLIPQSLLRATTQSGSCPGTIVLVSGATRCVMTM